MRRELAMDERNGAGPSQGRPRKALISLAGGLGAGVAIGVAIGVTVWSPLEGLALGLSLGAGLGGVPASLYYFGDLD